MGKVKSKYSDQYEAPRSPVSDTSCSDIIVRKPMNCFFRYKQYIRPKIISMHGRIINSEVSRITAEMWKNEDPELKKRFKEESRKAYEAHKLKYPDFVWPSKSQKFKESLKRFKEDKTTQDESDGSPVLPNIKEEPQVVNVPIVSTKKENQSLRIDTKISEFNDHFNFKTGWSPAVENCGAIQAFLARTQRSHSF
ncbi:hypothetical protein HDV02_002983 [Globomyces sp. JEL0801]|nr:hypothetical protein HDV02_002983 [Globomyces sp. JEL0801]